VGGRRQRIEHGMHDGRRGPDRAAFADQRFEFVRPTT
jgi:hypothetical protein